MSVTHFAGFPVFIHGRYLRQRCGWCGAVLVDIDLNGTTIQVRPGRLPDVPVYEPGRLVKLYDNVESVEPGRLNGLELVEPRIPLDSCAMLPAEVTR